MFASEKNDIISKLKWTNSSPIIALAKAFQIKFIILMIDTKVYLNLKGRREI